MARPCLRLARSERRNRRAGIQESALRRIFCQAAWTIRADDGAAEGRTGEALQNSAPEWPRRVTRRYHVATASSHGGDRVFWPENNRHRGARVARRTDPRALDSD